MKKRYAFIGLAVIAAIAVAVPAMGIDATSSVSVGKLNKKLKKLTQRVAALEATDPVPGPPGAQGAQGAQGEQGLQGAPGPSEASIERDGTIAMPDVKAQIQDRPTPAGSYVFWAKIDLSGGAAGTDVECDIATTAPAITAQDRATVDSPGGDGNTITLLAAETTTGGEVQLNCQDGVGGTVTANNVRLVAMRVGSLTEE
jgi:hypothetical protein